MTLMSMVLLVGCNETTKMKSDLQTLTAQTAEMNVELHALDEKIALVRNALPASLTTGHQTADSMRRTADVEALKYERYLEELQKLVQNGESWLQTLQDANAAAPDLQAP